MAGRIERRFAAMLEAGFADEVRALAARPAGLSRTARQALGYRELLSHVDDGVALGEAVVRAVQPDPPVRSPAADVVAARPQGSMVRVTRKPPGNTARAAGRLGMMADHRGRHVG